MSRRARVSDILAPERSAARWWSARVVHDPAAATTTRPPQGGRELAPDLCIVMRVLREASTTVDRRAHHDPHLTAVLPSTSAPRASVSARLVEWAARGCEFLDPIHLSSSPNLVTWGAIGAARRNQVHRELASGLSMPSDQEQRRRGPDRHRRGTGRRHPHSSWGHEQGSRVIVPPAASRLPP